MYLRFTVFIHSVRQSVLLKYFVEAGLEENAHPWLFVIFIYRTCRRFYLDESKLFKQSETCWIFTSDVRLESIVHFCDRPHWVQIITTSKLSTALGYLEMFHAVVIQCVPHKSCHHLDAESASSVQRLYDRSLSKRIKFRKLDSQTCLCRRNTS